MYKKELSVARHVLKTLTWRVVGTIDTILLSWFVSGDLTVGITIGSLEVVTKMVLYFLHERMWYKTNFPIKSVTRHILKTLTWRIIATIDTMLLAWWISGDLAIGVTIGSLEIVTKMVLYFCHERIWYLSHFGIKENKRD